MTRLFTIVLATLVVVASPAAADHTSARVAKKAKSARTAVVDVRGPTVVVFAPPQWMLDAKSDQGAVEEIAHVRFAVDDVNKCKGTARVAIRMVFADRLALAFEGRRSSIDLSHGFPDSAGAYLFRSGKKPCAIATPKDTAALGDILSHAVGEFFDVPGCLQTKMSAVCSGAAG